MAGGMWASAITAATVRVAGEVHTDLTVRHLGQPEQEASLRVGELLLYVRDPRIVQQVSQVWGRSADGDRSGAPFAITTCESQDRYEYSRPAHPTATTTRRRRTPTSTRTISASRRTTVGAVAVGTALTGGPPHRSQRALLTHWAPALGANAEAHVGKGMHHAGGR